MKTLYTKANQTAMDLVIMACGTLEGAMQIMAASGACLSDIPAVNTPFIIPDNITTDMETLSYIEKSGVEIGTFSAYI